MPVRDNTVFTRGVYVSSDNLYNSGTPNNLYDKSNYDIIDYWINNGYNTQFEIQPIVDKKTNKTYDFGKGVISQFNRYALFQYRGITDRQDNKYLNQSIFSNEKYIEYVKNPTVSNIISFFSNSKDKVAYQFDWGDFVYNKFYGNISNNYMICVRRFPTPVVDNIMDAVVVDEKTQTVINNRFPDLARAVTYLGEAAGNKLEDILKFKYNYEWQEIESKIQTVQSQNPGVEANKFLTPGGFLERIGGSVVGKAASSFAHLGSNTTTAAVAQQREYAGWDPLVETYPNYILGPLNVIKKMMIQGQGLTFEYEITLKFNYKLRAIGDINPKMAFLDLMANLLVLTYSNAPWWGGGNRVLNNGKFGTPLGDRSKLESGDIKGFMTSLLSGLGNMFKNVFGDGKGGFSLQSGLKGLGNLVGDMLGGWMSENLHSPHAAFALQALLSGEPSGYWHITIGNPFNPILMMGNMILTNTEIKFIGPLGADDFPDELEVVMTFKPARPRDKSEIESMFNAGRGRLYYRPKGTSDFLNLDGKENPNAVTGYKNGPQKTVDNKNNKTDKTVRPFNDQVVSTAQDATAYLKQRHPSLSMVNNNLYNALINLNND